jgi:hypothetical protein
MLFLLQASRRGWDESEQTSDLQLGTICLQELSNGNILIGKENQLLILHVDEMVWKKLGVWFSVGRADSESSFGIFPVENLFPFLWSDSGEYLIL